MYQIRTPKGRRAVRLTYTAALGYAIRAGSGTAIYTQSNHCLTRIG